MNFQQALDKIFQTVLKSAEENLNAYKEGILPDSSKPVSLQATGDIDFIFTTDSNGNYHEDREEWGHGITVNCAVTITNPDAIYNITVTSSDGGGGQWNSIRVNQAFQFSLRTSFWHKTKVSLGGNCTAPNTTGQARITYSY